MAASHIPIDTAKRLGQKLRRLVDMQREALSLMNEIKTVMEAQIDSADYTAVETQFGVPTGKGQTTYNLVTGARSAVNVSAVNQMLDWLG